MKTKFVLYLFLNMVLIALCGCYNTVTLQKPPVILSTTVREQIEGYISEHQNDEDIILDLSDITEFEWDEVVLYRSRATSEAVEEAIGLEYTIPENATMGFVFVSDNEIIYDEVLEWSDDEKDCTFGFWLGGYSDLDVNIIRIFNTSNDVFDCNIYESGSQLTPQLFEGDVAENGNCGNKDVETDNESKATKDVEAVIEAISNKDEAGVKEFLSPVLLEREGIDTELELMLEMFEGEFTDIEEIRVIHRQDYILSEPRCIWQFEYSLNAKDIEYRLFIGYLPQTVTEVNNTGVYSIRLMDYSPDDEEYKIYNSDYLITGIFPSTKERIQNNADMIMPYVIVDSELQEYYEKEPVAWKVAQRMDAMGMVDIETVSAETCENAEDELDGKYMYFTDSSGNSYEIYMGFTSGTLVEQAKNTSTGEVLYFIY